MATHFVLIASASEIRTNQPERSSLRWSDRWASIRIVVGEQPVFMVRVERLGQGS
jgi:hypothetical protein